MDSIRVSIIQTDIVWENKQENLRLLHEKLQSLRGTTEIVVLPEMFSTGFSMQSQTLAEPNSGKTISTLKQWASLFQLAIFIPYHGWNICLLVCYDLRFPVWSRNVKNEYDLLIYVANWPIPRRLAWDALLRARALENQCYVCGVNRTGMDGYHLKYNGGSKIYSAFGEEIASLPDEQEGIATTSLQLGALNRLREKFPVWKDADEFHL